MAINIEVIKTPYRSSWILYCFSSLCNNCTSFCSLFHTELWFVLYSISVELPLYGCWLEALFFIFYFFWGGGLTCRTVQKLLAQHLTDNVTPCSSESTKFLCVFIFFNCLCRHKCFGTGTVIIKRAVNHFCVLNSVAMTVNCWHRC